MLYIIILNEVFQRSFEEIEKDMGMLANKNSFVGKFICYLKSPILTYVSPMQGENSDMPFQLHDD